MLDIQLRAAEVFGLALSGHNLTQAFEDCFRRHGELTAQQRGAIREVCYEGLRAKALLAAQLDRLLVTPIRHAALYNLLLVALAQLQFSRAKPYAVVDHAVRAAGELGQPAARGLVNAVLRNFLRRREDLVASRFESEEVRHGFPQWWIDRMRRDHPQHWEGMLRAAQSHPPLTLRVNCRKGSVDGYAAELAGLGIDARIVGESAVEIPPRPVSEIPGFSEGRVSVQDAGAQHAAFLLGARAGERVLDACAAPGGKTGHLLELADLDLVALDSDPERLRKVRSNLDRLGLEASLLCADAGRLEAWWDGRPFDRILLDAPCSASGVTRRHPDIRWGRQETDPRRFARQQLELLGSLWKALAIGGTLLYATCSLFEEENGQVVQNFLNRMHDAENVPIERRGVVGGYVRPDERHDGFFYALLRKAPVGVA